MKTLRSMRSTRIRQSTTTTPFTSLPSSSRFFFSTSSSSSSSSSLWLPLCSFPVAQGNLRDQRMQAPTHALPRISKRLLATESKHSVAIPPPPPHKYKAVGDAFRIGSALMGVVLVGYIATREHTDEPHWTTQVDNPFHMCLSTL